MKAEARLPCPLLHLSLHLGVPTQLLEDLNKYEERFEGLKFELKKKKKKEVSGFLYLSLWLYEQYLHVDCRKNLKIQRSKRKKI